MTERTRRERRVRHHRVRRVVAGVTALGAVGLGVGLAAPAGARSDGGNCGVNDSQFTTYSDTYYSGHGGSVYTTHYCYK
jgi:hypothetical protein